LVVPVGSAWIWVGGVAFGWGPTGRAWPDQVPAVVSALKVGAARSEWTLGLDGTGLPGLVLSEYEWGVVSALAVGSAWIRVDGFSPGWAGSYRVGFRLTAYRPWCRRLLPSWVTRRGWGVGLGA
jgi:hypothetical protein